MSLAKLVSLLPPPKVASEVPRPPPWADVERQLGPLPADYKQFVECYGTGTIDNFITICNPFSANRFINLVSYSALARRALEEEVRSTSWSTVAPALDVSRLLPFGGTDNGDRIVWVTDGPPDAWRVMVLDSRGPFLDHFDGGMSEFLARVLEGTFRSNVLASDFPGDTPEFTPG